MSRIRIGAFTASGFTIRPVVMHTRFTTATPISVILWRVTYFFAPAFWLDFFYPFRKISLDVPRHGRKFFHYGRRLLLILHTVVAVLHMVDLG